jgi:hypothetical protein
MITGTAKISQINFVNSNNSFKASQTNFQNDCTPLDLGRQKLQTKNQGMCALYKN